ncbi:MAG: hypothetical protein OK452_07110 [Thaumarchaeota archaeon]|nr:hypothetical protein [Nitrososphaerota archaeon]
MVSKMLSASKSAALATLAPIPLVGSLAIYDWHDVAASFGMTTWFVAYVGIVFASSFLAVLLRLARPQFSVSKGSGLWFLAVVGGGGIYLLGSYYGQHWLHLMGLTVAYLGLVAYIGGGRLAGYMAAAEVAFATFALPLLFSGLALDIAGGVLIGATVILVAVFILFQSRPSPICDRCESYNLTGAPFCDFCGRRLMARVLFPFPSRRFLTVAIVSATVIVMLVVAAVPVVSLSSSTLQITNYKLSGVQGVTPLPSSPGWTTSLTKAFSNKTVTTFDYALRGPGSVNATISLAGSERLGFGVILGPHANLAVNGTMQLYGGQTAVTYGWSEGRNNFTGVLLVAPVTYLSAGRINQSYAFFFFAQKSSRAGVAEGGWVLGLANATSKDLQASRVGYFPLTAVAGPIMSNFLYALLISMIILCLIVGGVARSIDSAAGRLFDNSLSLESQEFEQLAKIALGGRSSTGMELLERIKPTGGWETLSGLLERLQLYGLVRKKIVSQGGNPKLVWAFGTEL